MACKLMKRYAFATVIMEGDKVVGVKLLDKDGQAHEVRAKVVC